MKSKHSRALKLVFITMIQSFLSFHTMAQTLINTNTNMGLSDERQRIIELMVDNKKIFGTNFAVSYGTEIWSGTSGNFHSDNQFFIASTTKLFVTAIIFKFQEKSLLRIEDKISKYLDSNIMKGLHILKGIDYSGEITIKHLLSHTSGLPDYFEDKSSTGVSLLDELISGEDQFWSFDDCLKRSKSLKPHFKPGEKKKAHYSDTNFQLLGKIIERISGKSFEQNLNELIIWPLELSNTYLYTDTNDNRPVNLYYKNHPLIIPKAMISFGPDGGIVSNSKDLLVFLKAFFNGNLFPTSYLEEMKVWNKIFFPMESGIGIHRFKLPWYFNPTGSIPEMQGHSGLSGALAYCNPEKKLFIVGTVNQVAYPDLSFKTSIKLINSTLARKR